MRTRLREGMVIKHPEVENGHEVIVVDIWEQEPRWNEYNRQTSYENRFVAKRLNDDGTFNSDAEDVKFSTCHVYTGSLNEDEIEIVRQMRKTYT